VYEGADIIDSRDIIERIEELETLSNEATDDEPMLEEDGEELKRLMLGDRLRSYFRKLKSTSALLDCYR